MRTPFSIVLLENHRSKAYLQTLLRFGFAPDAAIVMGPPPAGAAPVGTHGLPGFQAAFDAGESVRHTLSAHGIPFTEIPHLDTNAGDMIQAVRALPHTYLIYSGPAGIILRPPVLSQGKIFLHAHPGLVPAYKGSTTVYYAMLLEGRIGCSVITMNQEIDCGDILARETYPIPAQPADFDLVVDPLVRAETFLRWLTARQGDIAGSPPLTQTEAGHTFFIIHPVLKHLAILGDTGFEGDANA